VYGMRDGVAHDQIEQGLFMTLAVARSIRDVIDTFVTQKQSNFFGNRVCAGDESQTKGAIPNDYKEAPDARPRCYFVGKEMVGPDDARRQSFAGFALGTYNSDPRPWYEPLKCPEIGIGFELQRILSTSRVMVSPEVRFNLPLGSDALAFSWGPGFSFVGWADNYNGYGPDIHFYMDIKSWSTFFAVDSGYRFYNGEVSDHTPRVAGRLGFGNGVFSAYFGVGYDAAIIDGRFRHDGTTFGLGISASVSSTEIADLVRDRR